MRQQPIYYNRTVALCSTHSKPLSLSFVCCWLSVTLWMHRVAKRTHKTMPYIHFILFIRVCVQHFVCWNAREFRTSVLYINTVNGAAAGNIWDDLCTVRHVCLVSDCCRRVAWRSHEQFSIVLQTEKCQIIMYGTAGWMWVACVRCTKNTIMPGVSPHTAFEEFS